MLFLMRLLSLMLLWTPGAALPHYPTSIICRELTQPKLQVIFSHHRCGSGKDAKTQSTHSG